MQVAIRNGEVADRERIVEFLEEAGLGIDGLDSDGTSAFVLAEDDGGIRGCLGMEQFGNHGLLRSLAISAGIGEHNILELFTRMLHLAAEREITELYLATNKRNAISFFEMIGFKTIVKNELPSDFFHSIHVLNVLSVNNSVFLKYTL